MRVRIQVSDTPDVNRAAWQPAGAAWTVTASNLTSGLPILNAAVQPFERRLGAVGAAPELPFPLPPQPERTATARSASEADRLTFAWSTATDADQLESILAKFVLKTLSGDELEALGRYLFDTLIGDALWKAIDTLAGTGWIDLVLALPNQPELARLPWELVRSQTDFLARASKVSISREVASTAVLAALDRAPRLLFVVGTELTDGRVRPGAEYMQILRGLRARQFNIKTRLLCRATAKLVAAAVNEFRPDIVHFIGHGAVDPAKGAYIELLDDQQRSAPKPAFADAVEEMLSVGGTVPMPSMVILSACYTAVANVTGAVIGEVASSGIARVGQVSTPLAAHLVAKGVPMVIAMSGSVSDQASRMFTRQFYESVTTEQDVVQATALGRRAAIRDSGINARDSSDWAFPTLFVSSAVKAPQLPLSPAKDSDAFLKRARWRKLAENWPYGVPRLFCDRFEVLERFDLLLSDLKMQQALTGYTKLFSVLSVAVVDPETATHKFGRSWLLRELAAKAYADGHLPVVVSPASAPTSFDELMAAIIDSIDEVLVRLDLADRSLQLVEMLRATAAGAPFPAAIDIPPEMANRPSDRSPNAYARALRYDLQRLLTVVRERCRPDGEADQCRLVLLVDDVHRMATAAEIFLQNLIGKVGLSAAGDDIRVVFTWSLPPRTTESPAGQQHAIDTIKAWLNDQHELTRIHIGTFGRRLNMPAGSPEEAAMKREQRLAYEYYLLNLAVAQKGWQGIALRSGPANGIADAFWTMYSLQVLGVPSLLDEKTPPVFASWESWFDQVFQAANDEDWLRKAIQEQRP